MPKTIDKTKARNSKHSASKVVSKKSTKKIVGKTLEKKATKKVAGKTLSKKATKKTGNGLAQARRRKGKLLSAPKPLTPREKALALRAFQAAYESHQERLAEIADHPEDTQCI